MRAAATQTAFSNALTVSLFALVPCFHVSGAATAVAIIGILFIARALVSVAPTWRGGRFQLRDLSFLIGQFAAFVVQLIAAISLDKTRRAKPACRRSASF